MKSEFRQYKINFTLDHLACLIDPEELKSIAYTESGKARVIKNPPGLLTGLLGFLSVVGKCPTILGNRNATATATDLLKSMLNITMPQALHLKLAANTKGPLGPLAGSSLGIGKRLSEIGLVDFKDRHITATEEGRAAATLFTISNGPTPREEDDYSRGIHSIHYKE